MIMVPNKIYKLRNGAVIRTYGEARSYNGGPSIISFEFLRGADGYHDGYRAEIMDNTEGPFGAVREIEQ